MLKCFSEGSCSTNKCSSTGNVCEWNLSLRLRAFSNQFDSRKEADGVKVNHDASLINFNRFTADTEGKVQRHVFDVLVVDTDCVL